jgi:hypothetical protein
MPSILRFAVELSKNLWSSHMSPKIMCLYANLFLITENQKASNHGAYQMRPMEYQNCSDALCKSHLPISAFMTFWSE